MHEIEYRLATIADVEALVALRGAFLAEVSDATGSEPELVTAMTQYFRATLPTGEFIAYLAEAQGRIVATSGLIFHRNPPSLRNLIGTSGYVMNMYTLPEWRGRGIASAAAASAHRLSRQKGLRVSLHALPEAQALYAKAGFVPVDNEMRCDFSG